jgi:hypothetical protein
MKHIVMFSGGLGSFFAAKRVIDLYGPQDVILLFSDTLIEDEDLYRFLDDAENYFGIPITRIAEGRDPWQVFFDTNMLGSYRMDPCSKMLKRRFLKRWVKKNHHHKNCILYYGIDWTEEHRLKTIQQRMGKYECQAPLCWPPFETKSDLKQELADLGIPLPRLYSLGFAHNNCGGFCVKSGQAQFAKLLEHFPDRYAYHEQMEEKFRQQTGKDVAIMRKMINYERKPMTMKQFREWVQAGKSYDVHEFGGCGCA